jgi:hypothetical protein
MSRDHDASDRVSEEHVLHNNADFEAALSDGSAADDDILKQILTAPHRSQEIFHLCL